MREEIETSIGTELAPEEKTDSFTIKFHAEEGTRLSMGDEVEAWDQRLLRLRRRTQLGIGTGLPALDQATSGLRGMWLLTGSAGQGKTALALQIGVEAVRADPAVALCFVSLEASRWDLYDRVASRLAKLDHRVLLLGRRGEEPMSVEEKDRVADARNIMGEIGARVRIIDLPASELSESHIEYELRSLTSVEGRRPFVIIDSMDAWVAGRASSAEAEHERVESMKNIRTLVGESGALLVISEAPGLSSADPLLSVVGSARRAAAPDAILALKKADDRDMIGSEEGVSSLELMILKGRDGVSTGGVGLDFYYRENRFQPR
ncbi:MAG: DnaB-like helicase C-terminal domain-containing protein [Myxococcota bacterium]